MSYLDQIKGLKFKVSKVTVDGVDFYLRELSGKARLDFEGEKDLQLRVLKMMHASLCDADGKLTEKPKELSFIYFQFLNLELCNSNSEDLHLFRG